MSFIFISNAGGDIPVGTIILWYGTQASIPVGWSYYSSAAGKLVAGATVASTVVQGDATHKHAYSARTGNEGGHTHAVTLSEGSPDGATVPGLYLGGSFNANGATVDHANHSKSVTVSTAADHSHALVDTGNAASLPQSVGLYYIRKG